MTISTRRTADEQYIESRRTNNYYRHYRGTIVARPSSEKRSSSLFRLLLSRRISTAGPNPIPSRNKNVIKRVHDALQRGAVFYEFRNPITIGADPGLNFIFYFFCGGAHIR